MSRNKKNLGYELTIELSVKGKGVHDGWTGSIEMQEFCNDGTDPEVKNFKI
jgi:hypothetical protein